MVQQGESLNTRGFRQGPIVWLGVTYGLRVQKKTIILIWTWFFRSVCRCRWKLEFDSGGLPYKVLSDFWKNSQTWYFTCLTRNTPARHVFSPDKRPNCLGENDKPVIHIVFVFFLRINVCFVFCFAIFDILCHVFSWLWSRVFWFEYVCAFKSWSAFHFCIQSKLHFWKRSAGKFSSVSFHSCLFIFGQTEFSVHGATRVWALRHRGFFLAKRWVHTSAFVCRFTTCSSQESSLFRSLHLILKTPSSQKWSICVNCVRISDHSFPFSQELIGFSRRVSIEAQLTNFQFATRRSHLWHHGGLCHVLLIRLKL